MRNRFRCVPALALALGANDEIELAMAGGAAGGSAWPRACLVELPAGFVARGERLGVFERSGVERPTRITGCAADGVGETRLVRIDWAELPADRSGLRLVATHLLAPAPRLRCERNGKELSFRGAADEGAFVWGESSLEISQGDGSLVLSLGALGVEDDGEERRPSRLLGVGRTGPDGAGARLEATLAYEDEDGAADLRSFLRLEIAASGLQGELELALPAPRDLLIRRWVLRGRARGDPRLERGSSRVDSGKGGVQVVRETGVLGDIADPVAAAAALRLVAGSGRDRVALDWAEFGLARPSGARLSRDGSFELELVAEPIYVHAGQVVRRSLRLARGAAAEAAETRPWVVECGSARAPFDAAEVEWLAPWRDLLVAWIGAPRRLDDRGCYPERWGALANGEYDLGGSLLWLGRTLRDPGWLGCGEVIARHSLDWDRAEAPPPGIPAGLSWQHGDDHCSGEIEAGHQWIGGFLELARASGSLEALDAARARVVALDEWLRGGGPFDGPERRLAWPLRAAAEAGALLADPAARRLGDAAGARLLARSTSAGFIDGDRRERRDGPVVWVNSWVSLGITVESLLRAGASHGGGEAHGGATSRGPAEAAARLARFVAEQGATQDGLAEVLLVDPALAVAVERKGSCRRGNAALAAAGLRWWAGCAGDARAAALASALRERSRADLARPDVSELTELAKALLALRFEREQAALTDAAAGAYSRSSPSSLRTGRPRENR